MVWWDDVELTEAGSSGKDYTPRGLKLVRNGVPGTVVTEPYLDRLNLGEQMIGRNTLSANLICLAQKSENLRLELEIGEGATKQVFQSAAVAVGANNRSKTVTIDYTLKPQPVAYDRVRATLRIVNTATGAVVDQMPVAFSPWGTPIDLRLGALYLQPNQKQFVRANLGLSYAELQRAKELRIEVVRRGSNEVLKTFTVPATPADIAKQRTKIPDGLRGDFRNLLLSDIDVSFLPVQPFADPQRNWLIRATLIDTTGASLGSVLSPPFCRLAHDTPQPAITSVKINEHGDFLVNDKPWMPWGVTYGHNPVYDGPAETAKVHNLTALKMWSLYDRHGGNLGERAIWDINCLRHVEGPVIKQPQLEEMWKKNLYASTVFIKPPDAKNPWPDDQLKYLRTAPNVAAVSRGPEEAFGYFYPMTAQQLDSLKGEVDYLRRATGKPVMVGHGGYWTRLEFEKVPFFDIYDPETEPWYPAPLHTDLMPLVAGKGKAVWLRPQMYESVPYERWRYHVYVELMRGARGWQIAHGPGDSSLMRGLHAELRYVQPFVYSREKPPEVKIAGTEYFTRQLGNKTFIASATTHGMTFGNWFATAKTEGENRVRTSADPHIFRDESDGYHATGDPAAQKYVPHGIQYLPHAQKWPTGSKIVTRVFIDKTTAPKNITLLAKCDGRWTHAATWGKGDFAHLRSDNASAYWFLRTFYRHARGFLGWGDKVPANAMELVPGKFADRGAMPEAGKWVTLELPLDAIGATDKLLDGVAFMHEGGMVQWSRTAIVTPDGKETIVFGDHEDRPNPDSLRETKVFVAGLKKGTKVRVLFEDRVIVAEDGYFVDDFRGADLYQRYGGERTGYGNAPVALHLYEIEAGK
jgi:hypothetical protein